MAAPVFPAVNINQQSQDTAKDCIPVTASSTNNVFGDPYNISNPKAEGRRACRALYADAAATISFVAATGVLRSNVVIQAGVFDVQVIQVTSITGANIYALI